MSEKLTAKEEKFVRGLAIEGLSQRKAYRAAYKASKMKDASVDVKACNLFAQDKIKLRFNEIRDRFIEEAEEEGIIDAKKVLRHVASIAFDDISNYLDFRTEKRIIELDKNFEPVFGYGRITELKDSRDINTQNVSEISVGKDGQFKMKLYERDKALYKLMDHLGVARPKDQEQNEDTMTKLDKILDSLDAQVGDIE